MIKEYIDKDNKKYYEIKNHYIGKDIFTGKEKRISKKGFRTKKEAENYCIKLKVLKLIQITHFKMYMIYLLSNINAK